MGLRSSGGGRHVFISYRVCYMCSKYRLRIVHDPLQGPPDCYVCVAQAKHGTI